MDKTKIAFFGSSKFSLPYLDLLNKMEGLELSLVVSQPDKPTDRGLELTPTPVKLWAKQKNVLVLAPSDLKESLFLGALESVPLDVGLCAYYGLIIPGVVISHFPMGVLNVHHSLLPKHRGANPIPWSILSGEAKTGTTLIKINEKIDDGLILGQVEEAVRETDTAQTLRGRLDERALALLEQLLPEYLTGNLVLNKQNGESSYDPKITKEMARIDWSKSDREIECRIRAFDPWPGAWTTLEELVSSRTHNSQLTTHNQNKEKRVKILKAHLDKEKGLIIEKLQIESKRIMTWQEFENGYLRKIS